MKNAMKRHAIAVHTVAGAAFLAAAFCGCTAARKEFVLEAPIIERDPIAMNEPTLLEQFHDVRRKHEAARLYGEELAARVSDLTKRNEKLIENIQTAEEEIAGLEEKNRQLEDVSVKYDAAQKELLEMGKTLRGVRHELLSERLARVKLEQELVAMKLQNAHDRRRELLKDATAESADDSENKEDEENG